MTSSLLVPKMTTFSTLPHLVIINYKIMQVIAFSDEEGVRFQSTFLGSAAIAGILPVSSMEISDKRFCCVTPNYVDSYCSLLRAN